MNKLVFILPGIEGGGAEKFVLNLYKAMELNKGYECHVVSLSRKTSHALDPGIRVHYVDDAEGVSKKGFKRYSYRRVIARIVDDYIDNFIGKNCVVLSNMMHADKVMSLSRHRVVHIIHSAYSQSLLGGLPFYRQFFIKKNINKVYSHHPMIFVSNGALESFCASFSTDVKKYVIHNPVDEQELRALADSESAELQDDYIIHVGRFNRQKRHDRLLEAFAKLKTDINLVLLGEGKLEPEIRAMVDELGLTRRVVFMGFQQNPYPFIKRAKALVLPSDVEGLSTVLQEAICLGTPVIATDCPGGMREIVPADSPSLVPLDDINRIAAAIDESVVNPQKYITSLDKKFNSQFIADQYDQLLRTFF